MNRSIADTVVPSRRARSSLGTLVLFAWLALGSPACTAEEPADLGEDDIAAEEEDTSAAEDELAYLPNLALARPASQSSTGWDGVASRAVDGNTSGAWNDGSVTHTALESQPWWQVDLQSVQAVGEVVVHNRTDCCSDRLSSFKLLVSEDGSTWSTYNYSGVAPTQVRFYLERPARYVKVQLNGTNYLSLAEVQVFPPVPTTQWYHLCSRHSGKLVTADGTNVTMTPFSGSLKQFWKIDAAPAAGYRLQSRNDGQYLSDVDVPVPIIHPFLGIIGWELKRAVLMQPLMAETYQAWQFAGAGPSFDHMLAPRDQQYLEAETYASIAPWSGAARQYWRVMPSEPSREDADETLELRPGAASDSIPVPPPLTELEVPPQRTPEVLIGDTPVQYIHVKDRSPAWQVESSPYYRLSRHAFWERLYFNIFSGLSANAVSNCSTTGYIKSYEHSIETAMGQTVTGSASFGYGPISAHVSKTVSQDLKVTTSMSNQTAVSTTTCVERSVPISPNESAIVVYARGDRYELTAADGLVVASWTYIDQNVRVEWGIERPRQ